MIPSQWRLPLWNIGTNARTTLERNTETMPVTMDNFNTVMEINATADNVYAVLTTAIPKWWTEMFDGTSDVQGASFTIRFGPNVYKTMVVEELVPHKKVVWKVTASLIDIPELTNKTEWVNTEIVWEISSHNDQTSVHLTHFGLTPQIECYDICQSGWHNFTDSLTDFLHTGVGRPYRI